MSLDDGDQANAQDNASQRELPKLVEALVQLEDELMKKIVLGESVMCVGKCYSSRRHWGFMWWKCPWYYWYTKWCTHALFAAIDSVIRFVRLLVSFLFTVFFLFLTFFSLSFLLHFSLFVFSRSQLIIKKEDIFVDISKSTVSNNQHIEIIRILRIPDANLLILVQFRITTRSFLNIFCRK